MLCVSRSAFLHFKVVATDLLFSELILTLIMSTYAVLGSRFLCLHVRVVQVFLLGGGLNVFRKPHYWDMSSLQGLS